MKLPEASTLITGGASGLGAATARWLSQAGAPITISDLDDEGGQALAAMLGPQAHFVQADVTESQSLQRAIAQAAAMPDGLRIAVGCAGVISTQKVLGKAGPADLGHFTQTMAVNVVGMFNLIRLAAAAMANNVPNVDGERGVIVTTASVAAFDGQIGQAAYAASKAAVVGMTLPVARELARHGIRIVSIAPGIFDTPMLARFPETVRTALGQQVPFPPRLGRPEEFAMLVQHIIENPMLNGETIRLDGAIRMAP